MRYLHTLIFLIFTLFVSGQDFSDYTDTTNHFSISIPNGWEYGTMKDFRNLKLIARSPLSNKHDTTNVNFNVNIFDSPVKNLEETFEEYTKNLEAKELEFIEKGDIIVNGREFKWLIETHINTLAEVKVKNYSLVTLKDGKVYMLTLSSFLHTYEFYKSLFDKIVNSFIIL